MRSLLCGLFYLLCLKTSAQQTDSTLIRADTTVQFIEQAPSFSIHVDSLLYYNFSINKNPDKYFWYIKNAPAGVRLNKETGTLSFKADKSYFLSNRLRYDQPYRVTIGVQRREDAAEKTETIATIVFFNTDIIPSTVKPSVSGAVWVDEGEAVSFKVLCEKGSFPFEQLLTLTSVPIEGYKGVGACGDAFEWTPPYDLVNETDSGKVKLVDLFFIGHTKFNSRDTARVRLIVKDALNYPMALQDYNSTVKNIENYLLQLKYSFLQLDRRLKKTKNLRTTFDITSASTSVTGTVMTTSNSQSAQRTGKILPSVGLAMVPIKEAAVPNKTAEQNGASQLRTAIKRLEYLLTDNALAGDRDYDIRRKTIRLKDEWKATQIQLIDVPLLFSPIEQDKKSLDAYFNNPKVNKKYRTHRR